MHQSLRAIKTLTLNKNNQVPLYPPTPRCYFASSGARKNKPNAFMPSCIYRFPKRIGMPYVIYLFPQTPKVLARNMVARYMESLAMSFLSNQEEKNGCCVGSYRRELADTPNLLAALTKAAFKTQFRDQQLSASHNLKHPSDDPFNWLP